MKKTVAAAALALLPTVALSWKAMEHAQTSGQDAIFHSVKAFSGTDAWAVGHRFGTVGGALEFRTLTFHWDGAEWRQSPSLDIESAPSTTFFKSVDGLRGGPVFAAGWFRRPRESAQTMIQRFDGSSWSLVPTPNPSATGNYLEAIAVASETVAYAAGSSHDRAQDGVGLLIRWDGIEWTPVTLPALDFCLKWTYLTGLAVRPSGHGLATGYCLKPDGDYQGFVLRGNGARWRLAAGPRELPGSTILNDVDFVSSTEAWAVGSRQYDAHEEALILRLQEGAWTELPPPAGSDATALMAVAAASPTMAWAVGNGTSSQPPFAGVATLYWDGATWRDVRAGDFGTLRGVDVLRSGRAFAAGAIIDDSLILRGGPPPAIGP